MFQQNIAKVFLVTTFVFFTGCQSSQKTETAEPTIVKSDILWNIVSTKCVPNQKTNHNPAPCEEVTLNGTPEQGFVVLKDRRGPLQYLLMPATKITGIESPEILAKNSPNYFYEAWKARSYMSKKAGTSIEDREVSLAINSPSGRSQNQLHIHISCVRPDVRRVLDVNQKAVKASWSPFPAKIVGHVYSVRLVTEKELKDKGAFYLLSEELPTAKNRMNEYGMALVSLSRKNKMTSFALLAEHVDNTQDGSAEEIQDHECPQLVLK